MKIKTPIKAIRAKCLDCCCGSFYEVEKCVIKNCALYAYRFGCRPETAERRNEKKTAVGGTLFDYRVEAI